jgi:hypothetical protein
MKNTGKTIAMSFHIKQKRYSLRPHVTFKNMDIAIKSELKFLGIYITGNLKWCFYVKSLSQKLSKIYYIIKSLKEVMSPTMVRSIYYAHLHALLWYGIIFLGGDNESNSIFKLQKGVIRIISGVSKHTSCRQIFKDYNILTVACLYILEMVCYTKKYKDSLKQNVQFHNYNT